MPSQDNVPVHRTWMFNENARNHRGVWHIVEGPLKAVTVPERHWDYDIGVWLKHYDRRCHGTRSTRTVKVGKEPYTWLSREEYWEGCDCPLQSDNLEVQAGSFITRTVYPEHKEIRNQPVLCHQVEINGSTLLTVSRKDIPNKEREIGGMQVTTHRLVPFHTFIGELPPGPTCSRCIARAERDGT